MNRKYLLFFSLPLLTLSTPVSSVSHLQSLYHSLDPHSLTENLAFYELYPDTEEGKKSIERAARLLKTPSTEAIAQLLPIVNPLKNNAAKLTLAEIEIVEQLGSRLSNRNLKGYCAVHEKDLFLLLPEEIDLGMALVLSQMSGEEEAHLEARRYSALLDLMALQIIAYLPPDATPEQKIQTTNHLIFDQMRFRFPPQSLYAQDIDRYTFLPSVMDNHLGVCLGVTTIYLAIAQRIDLPLEIITPPGHIYVRYREGNKQINIETTARGVHMPDETYLSVNTKSLKKRNMKEVIGMTYVNQASIYIHTGLYEKAINTYKKAHTFLPEEPLVKEFMGYCYLFTDQKEEGKVLFEQACTYQGEELVVEQSMIRDYLAGHVGPEGIKAVLLSVDEDNNSIIAKQKELEAIVALYPKFRDGLRQLAITWIQLNRPREALAALMQSHHLDPTDPVTEYYLSVLYKERQDFKNAWYFLKNAEAITAKVNFYPKALKELRRELLHHCPD